MAAGINESQSDFASAVKAPPLLISFESVETYLLALPDELQDAHAAELRKLVDAGLPPVVSFRALATLFGFSTKFLGALHRKPERYYRTFSIRKGKKIRYIQSPRVGIKVIQKWFGHHLSRSLSFSDSVVGFVPGRSAVEGAAKHCGADWIYSTDIRDFFSTTPVDLVEQSLVSLGYSSHASQLIARLCSYNGYLAQGSPASPVLSNLVFQEIDVVFDKAASEYGARYTRYADDIVFSGHGDFPEDLRGLVSNAVTSRGWNLAQDKERLAKRPTRLKIYGLVVEGSSPRLTKGYRNRIRAYRHLKANNQIVDQDLNRINGHLSYAACIERFVAAQSDEEIEQ